jgi:DNA (cytosine-5)-methyltransferase 1
MKLGGLFSGVGGFELAWTQLGHEVAWMCEWDAKARKVLEARFPSVPIYPDVRDLDPAEVEAVDVLTGGSPCQGFSIAGTRSGLEHSESQLFADYVRIMDGLAERGLRYAIWENVPGVLSIRNDDGERTFTHVVGALAGGSAAVRLDAKRKWNAGLVANGGRAVSWRVLDSRHFGVAQRRRRVFACVAFGDSAADRAGRTLLAVGEGVRWDSASGVGGGRRCRRRCSRRWRRERVQLAVRWRRPRT